MEYWNGGMMDYWISVSKEFVVFIGHTAGDVRGSMHLHHSNIPVFHHSTSITQTSTHGSGTGQAHSENATRPASLMLNQSFSRPSVRAPMMR